MAVLVTAFFILCIHAALCQQATDYDYGDYNLGNPIGQAPSSASASVSYGYGYGTNDCERMTPLNPMAERALEQLLRQNSGNVAAVIASLERRFNLRSSGSLQTRLAAVTTAANVRISAAGYGSWRPIITAVSQRIGCLIGTNNPWSSSSQRPGTGWPSQTSSPNYWRTGQRDVEDVQPIVTSE